jgi:hypothetical protein
MNLIKAIFSGHRGFKEEFASALLGYLMSPNMDHGLGTVFLKRFLESLKVNEDKIPKVVGDAIEYLSSNTLMGKPGDESLHPIVEVFLEYERCDIVIQLKKATSDGKDAWLLIENKIGAGSVGNIVEQVNGYYLAISNKDKSGDCFVKIAILPLDQHVGHYKGIDSSILWTSWRREGTSKAKDTIVDILRKILRESAEGSISPLPSDTEYMLRSLINFVEDSFEGYRGNRKSITLADFVEEMSIYDGGDENKNRKLAEEAIDTINKIYAEVGEQQNACGMDGPIIGFKTNSEKNVWPFKIRSDGYVLIQHQGMKKLKLDKDKENNVVVRKWLCENIAFKEDLGETSFNFSFDLLFKDENLKHFIDVLKRIKSN